MRKESYWRASKTSQRMKRGNEEKEEEARDEMKEGKREADEPSSLSRDRNLIRTLWLWSEAIFSSQEKREREDHVIDKRPALYVLPNLVLRLPSNKNRREQVFFSYDFLFLPSKTPPSFNSLLYLLRQLLNYLYFEIQDWLQASRVEVDLFCLTSDDCIQYSENSSWLLF